MRPTDRAIKTATEILTKQIRLNTEFLEAITKTIALGLRSHSADDVTTAIAITNLTVSFLQVGLACLTLLAEDGDEDLRPGRWKEI